MTRKIVTVVALTVLAACAWTANETVDPPEPAGPPNVVLLVGDGFGVGAWGLARAWADRLGRPLALDEAEAWGFLDTRCLDELVTDSAAAATAWSTGRLGKRMRVGFPGEDVPNLFERLREAERAYGFVTTARVTHYTLAPFYARATHRGLEDDVAVQLVEAPPDVAIGGGARHFLPEAAGGHRTDGRDLLGEARESGIEVLRDSPDSLPGEASVLAILADSHLPHDLDRGPGDPDLAELSTAALRRLRATGRPWFLLVEAARIDHAAHDHDGAGLVRNTLQLDRALEAVLAETDRSRTLVVVASAHETGNPALLESAHPESLEVVSASVEAMEERIFGGRPWRGTPASLREAALAVLDGGARHTGLSGEDLDRLLSAVDVYERRMALGSAVSRRFGIAFLAPEDRRSPGRRHGHTGDPVPVRAWGPRAAEIGGIRDHAALGRWIADVLELSSPGDADSAATAPIDTTKAAG